MKELEEQETALVDDDEDDEESDNATSKKRQQLEWYRTYLERTLKQRKIVDRAQTIDAELTTKLLKDMVQVIHTSASDYMNWTKRPKIGWAKQPALTPELTGIPTIRDILYGLPAGQNYLDLDRHLNVVVPGFMNKVKRAVRDVPRDAGFRTIAEDFDCLREGFMSCLLAQAKSAFQDCSKGAIKKVLPEVPTLKDQLADKIDDRWLLHKSAAFLRIMKCGGTVPRGTSKAQGLERGCNFNKELGMMLTPAFGNWQSNYTSAISIMGPALGLTIGQLDYRFLGVVDVSRANLATAERAKMKWQGIRDRIQVKISLLMRDVQELAKLMYSSVTIEFDQERNTIAYLNDKIYARVLVEDPEEKPPVKGKESKTKRYVEPKLQYKKKLLAKLFLHPDNHFIDRVLKHFHAELDHGVCKLLDEHFAGINELLSNFGASLKKMGDSTYTVTPEGKAIRADLTVLMPEVDEEVNRIRDMLPKRPKSEDDMPAAAASFDGMDEYRDEDLATIFKRMEKKHRDAPPAKYQPKTTCKRVKTEPF